MNKNDQIKQIEDALQALRPSFLQIVDNSDKHRGHGGWREGVVTHIHVKIASPLFEGKSRIERHRMTLDLLDIKSSKFLHSVNISIVGCA